MSPLAPIFVLATLLCFAFGTVLVASAIRLSFLHRFASNRFTTLLSFSLAGSAAILAGCYLCILLGVGLGFPTKPDAWQSWLFLGCALIPHLLWSERFRRPLIAGTIAAITLSGITPEFLSITAGA